MRIISWMHRVSIVVKSNTTRVSSSSNHLTYQSQPLIEYTKCRRQHQNAVIILKLSQISILRWVDHYYHHQRKNHDCKSHEDKYQNRATTGRELALDDPFLSLEVPSIAHYERQDADAQESGTQRLSHVPQGMRPSVLV